MKHFVILQILILVLFSACNTSEDYFAQFNQKPEITVKGILDNDFYRKEIDSIKINHEYHLYYKINNEENEKLKAYVTCDNIFTYKIDNEKITILSKKKETGKFKIYTKDSFGATDELTIKITCFVNLQPVPILEIEDIPGFKFEKKLNASQSYDTDNEYGGGISLYRFFVNGKEFEKTYHTYMDYTFPSSGQYEIGLQVKDTDGQWSDRVNKTLIID